NHSLTVWVSFAHHLRTIREPGQPSGWRDWPMVRSQNLSRRFPFVTWARAIRDRDASHSLMQKLLGHFPFTTQLLLGRISRTEQFRRANRSQFNRLNEISRSLRKRDETEGDYMAAVSGVRCAQGNPRCASVLLDS